MAIVFISPQRRQRVLIFAVIGFFLLAMVIIALAVYLAKPRVARPEEYFTAPAIRINWGVLKSDQVTNLEAVPAIKKEFQFNAKAPNGTTKTGIVSASSEEEATQALKNLNLTSIVLSELKPGRQNPFSPYYQIGK
jgi:hypothetical protein